MGINKDGANVALEWVKQIITLSSGIVALTATFLDKIIRTPSWSLFFLLSSWACLIISVVFGLETISVIVKSHLDNDNKWSVEDGLKFAKTCKYLFIAGISLFCVFAVTAFLTSQTI